jgi:uncharacterized glyoxalase superfamily protein PhnB
MWLATANYYRDQLGFYYDRFWNEPPAFCMVKRNGVVIMLGAIGKVLERCGPTIPSIRKARPGTLIFEIDDADALYHEFKSKGVKIAREICDQDYGCRDFDVEDCKRYRLCFWRGQRMTGGRTRCA